MSEQKPELGDLTHIERSSLPWRPEHKTECGLDASRHPTWTREEAAKLKNDLGSRRFSMHVCMTCDGTASRHQTWEEDPASCMVRHAHPLVRGWGGSGRPVEARRFADELRAIAGLIEAHRDEFDALVKSFGEVAHIDDARRQAAAWKVGGNA